MPGFTKLVPEIVQSSIWNESPEVRVVWITMLAVKDENGYVRGTPETLARLANVNINVVYDSLQKFSSPDPSSHTPANEGRRIADAPGGWIVLNAELYRNGHRTAYMRTYMRDYRRKHVKVNSKQRKINSKPRSVSVSVSESGNKNTGVHGTDSSGFDAFWKAYPRKVGKLAARRAWNKIRPGKELAAAIVNAIDRQKGQSQWRKDGGQYIPNPATWLNEGRWDDEPVVKQAATLKRNWVCEVCGKPATSTIGRHSYCSDECRFRVEGGA